MTANKTDPGAVAHSDPQPTHKHPPTLKTSFTDTAEPADSNSMGPTSAPTSAPASTWYVPPPAPSHPNITTRRHSAASATHVAAFSPSTPSAALTDVSLESENIVAPSPTETSMASAVSSLFTPTSSVVGGKSATSAMLLPSNATTEVEFVLESPLEIEMQRFCNDSKTPKDSVDISSVIPKQNNQHGGQPLESPSGQQQQSQTQGSSFFSDFFAIPPSLAGRPRLTEEQEEYMRRQFQSGPVPLMWPKEDLENQNKNLNKNQSEEQPSTQSTGSGWFANWWTPFATGKGAETRQEGAIAQ